MIEKGVRALRTHEKMTLQQWLDTAEVGSDAKYRRYQISPVPSPNDGFNYIELAREEIP